MIRDIETDTGVKGFDKYRPFRDNTFGECLILGDIADVVVQTIYISYI